MPFSSPTPASRKWTDQPVEDGESCWWRAAICHGPWTLVEAGVMVGKDLTSWPSLQTDIRNAGGEWQDSQVVDCPKAGFTSITSRKPDDLDAFDAALVQTFAK
nr:DJ-1/PfpI family protein [Nakamurella panacisegetis]